MYETSKAGKTCDRVMNELKHVSMVTTNVKAHRKFKSAHPHHEMGIIVNCNYIDKNENQKSYSQYSVWLSMTNLPKEIFPSFFWWRCLLFVKGTVVSVFFTTLKIKLFIN